MQTVLQPHADLKLAVTPSFCPTRSRAANSGHYAIPKTPTLIAVMATTDQRLARLAEAGRLRTEVAFARRAMLALSNGVTSLCAHGASDLEVQDVGRFLLQATLGALLRQ